MSSTYINYQTVRATINDFVCRYGLSEAVELTRKANPANQTICETMLQAALDDAEALIMSYIEVAPLAGKAIIASSFKRVQCIIARHYLDSVRRRPDVKEDYEMAIQLLDTESGIAEQSKWRTSEPGTLILFSNKRRPQFDKDSMDSYLRMNSYHFQKAEFLYRWHYAYNKIPEQPAFVPVSPPPVAPPVEPDPGTPEALCEAIPDFDLNYNSTFYEASDVI